VPDPVYGTHQVHYRSFAEQKSDGEQHNEENVGVHVEGEERKKRRNEEKKKDEETFHDQHCQGRMKQHNFRVCCLLC
jgi:hypothetical protein